MIFVETPLAGAFVIELERSADERGSFARCFCQQEFELRGLNPILVQASLSYNHRSGTLRGLHFQRAPNQEDRLVRCTRGSIFDAIVDLRPDSSSFGRAWSVTLSAEAGNQLYVPKDFAHGFLTLEDHTEVSYHMSVPYAPDAGGGYRYDDPSFAIEWPQQVVVISEQDLGLPYFRETAR